jgi:hypothetical protein
MEIYEEARGRTKLGLSARGEALLSWIGTATVSTNARAALSATFAAQKTWKDDPSLMDASWAVLAVSLDVEP